MIAQKRYALAIQFAPPGMPAMLIAPELWLRSPTHDNPSTFIYGAFINADGTGAGSFLVAGINAGLNVKAPDEARAIATVDGEQVATIGDNRKMVIFPLDQLPEMTRGAGVRMQRYKDGGLSDVKTFKGAEGLTWKDASDRTFSLTLKELADWRGNRADAGRLAPKGFPRSNKFK